MNKISDEQLRELKRLAEEAKKRRGCPMQICSITDENNAKFIIAARSAIRPLIDEVERLKNVASKFGGYVISCRIQNTPEYIQGLAEKFNDLSKAIGDCETFFFDGGGIRRTNPRPDMERTPVPTKNYKNTSGSEG